ncbi:recombinase family protein [Chromobacterium haemolyticum]|nr:recombinase family protein [Chromobacterium haemolyticum]
MSTEHQQYSTENQAAALFLYAQQRNIEIVRTYADEGKSGLRLDGRDALKNLLEDVETGAADYSTILVYDVSRWGRFQDPDESASYEIRCKHAGVSVQYCAEQFVNDGSPVSSIIKSVKRTLAGEYSRELSVKVFAGQARLIERGYRQGGTAGYGLRRQLVDHTGAPKALLTRGEHKSIQTDRIILIPGPAEEVTIIGDIYRTFVEEGRSEQEIASMLNQRGITTDLGRAWTRGTVHQVLINEKYIGNNVWNHGSFKLKNQRVRNSPEQWVRADGAFEPIVNKTLFNAAQAIIQSRSYRLSDEEMLDALRQLYLKQGSLSGLVIARPKIVPPAAPIRAGSGACCGAMP